MRDDYALENDDPLADIADPDVYVRGVPHLTFKRLRDEEPVSRWEETGGSGFWAITRYEDIVSVSHNWKTFSAARGIRLEEMTAEELIARRTLMEMDPPEHTTYRRMVQPPFTHTEVRAAEAGIRLLARSVVDDVSGTERFDFVEAIARRLPMRMLGKMLGIPDEDGAWLAAQGDALIGNTDPEFTTHPVGLVDTDPYRLMPFRSPASRTLFAYAEEQARQRRHHPTDDVISMMLRPKRDGAPLSEEEFKNFFTLLVAAGNDTTRYTMTAGMLALLQHPEQMAELRDTPSLCAGATEEILRWGTVTMHFRRTAVQDADLSGTRIRAGDKVLLWFISGDYDERQFADPFRFDIRRTPNEHLAFGLKSPHKCIGEHLARIEIQALLEELLPRLTDVRLNGPVERLRSNFISGIKHLPLAASWA
ncbi:MAG TPA: cytochrome P450 [Vicinamibacterales bacterium]|nr:cytochrome P450 [Vicinamibacterales bacterium]